MHLKINIYLYTDLPLNFIFSLSVTFLSLGKNPLGWPCVLSHNNPLLRSVLHVIACPLYKQSDRRRGWRHTGTDWPLKQLGVLYNYISICDFFILPQGLSANQVNFRSAWGHKNQSSTLKSTIFPHPWPSYALSTKKIFIPPIPSHPLTTNPPPPPTGWEVWALNGGQLPSSAHWASSILTN